MIVTTTTQIITVTIQIALIMRQLQRQPHRAACWVIVCRIWTGNSVSVDLVWQRFVDFFAIYPDEREINEDMHTLSFSNCPI